MAGSTDDGFLKYEIAAFLSSFASPNKFFYGSNLGTTQPSANLGTPEDSGGVYGLAPDIGGEVWEDSRVPLVVRLAEQVILRLKPRYASTEPKLTELYHRPRTST